MNGWFYLLGNYPEYWVEYSDPLINKYYYHGEANCPSECHICIAKAFHLLGVNTCIEEVTYETVLLDTDSHRNNKVPDQQLATGDNDLIMGIDPILEHPQNFPSLALGLSDLNEPYYIPERGILFKGD